MSVDPIEQLLTQPLERLRDPKFVADMVREVGLHQDPKAEALFGKHNIPYMRVDGMLQIPEQLADALIYLSDKEIIQYLEIGTFNGLTTAFITAYLTRFQPQFRCMTVDLTRKYNNTNPNLRIVSVLGTSDDWRGFVSDLCFIDGDHSMKWVEKDYDNVGLSARIVMFHDILEDTKIGSHPMDVKAFWQKRKRPTSHEFTQGGRMGIGIL